MKRHSTLVLFTFFIFSQNLFAQETCIVQTGDEREVEVSYNIVSETPIGNGLCEYVLTLTAATVDGLDAGIDITVNVIITPEGGTPIPVTITIPANKNSKTLPNQPMAQQVPCGQTGMLSANIDGGTSCPEIEGSLPVDLTSFEAVVKGERVNLTWSTASELENLGFEIQRSTDGYKWEMLGFVKGKGTTFDIQKYEWMDKKPYFSQTNYYRLKQIDFDDSYEYSEITVSKISNKVELVFYPNPVRDYVTIEIGNEHEGVYIEVFDMKGRLVKSLKRHDNYFNIDLSELENGIYWLTLLTDDLERKVKFVKQ